MKTIKRIIPLVLLLCLCPAFGQVQDIPSPGITMRKPFTATGSGDVLDLRGRGINYHRLKWNVVSASGCSVKVEKSADGVTYADHITAQTCTSNGVATVVTGVVNYIKVTLSTLAGAGAQLETLYEGFRDDPAAAGGSGGTVDQGTAGADPWDVKINQTGDNNAIDVLTTPGLTDTQLRATAVPVSGSVTATGPATNTELRASALPVSLPTSQVGIDCNSSVVYDASTNGNTELVALTASQTIYVCGFYITSAATTAVGVRLVYGTGTACATGENGMTPVTTYQNSAGVTPTGLVIPVSGHTGLKTAVSNALCIETNAAQAVQALVWYTKF